MSEFTWERRVEFCETDAAGIVHFSSLILYMEQAEHALLRSIGYSVAALATSREISRDDVFVTWPRVQVSCEFHAPARFEDVLTLGVHVTKLGSKSIAYQHRVLSKCKLVATGTMTSVCCSLQNGHITSQPIPDEMRLALKQFELPSNLDNK